MSNLDKMVSLQGINKLALENIQKAKDGFKKFDSTEIFIKLSYSSLSERESGCSKAPGMIYHYLVVYPELKNTVYKLETMIQAMSQCSDTDIYIVPLCIKLYPEYADLMNAFTMLSPMADSYYKQAAIYRDVDYEKCMAIKLDQAELHELTPEVLVHGEL